MAPTGPSLSANKAFPHSATPECQRLVGNLQESPQSTSSIPHVPSIQSIPPIPPTPSPPHIPAIPQIPSPLRVPSPPHIPSAPRIQSTFVIDDLREASRERSRDAAKRARARKKHWEDSVRQRCLELTQLIQAKEQELRDIRQDILLLSNAHSVLSTICPHFQVPHGAKAPDQAGPSQPPPS